MTMVGLLAGLLGVQPVALAAVPGPSPEEDVRARPVAATAPAAVPAADRARVLGERWRDSTDRALLATGDAGGFHILAADAMTGYAWKTVSTLSEPGVETDRWIGNMCVTASGRRAVVVYAPRTFTNDERLFDRGGFTAVVDLTTGDVTRLPVRSSLAYFTPACGAGEQTVLTQGGDTDLGRTRLIRVDAEKARIDARIEVPGQLTSAVPVADGIVAADSGALVRVAGDGSRRVLAATQGVAFDVAADAAGGVVYLERSGADRARARRVSVPAKGRAVPATLASNSLTGLDVTSGRGGRVFVLGAGAFATGSRGVSGLDAPPGSRPSLDGELVVTSVLPTTSPATGPAVAGLPGPQRLAVKATATKTRTATAFTVTPEVGAAPVGESRRQAALLASPTDPADFAERYCSVPRNDPRNQVMQPKPRQVEWAVDQAVRGVLNVSRPANWKNLGMPAYTPQGLFPPRALVGGGAVPAQIMLGIAAQESNLWQAARFAVPGVTANPLIGNYYGLDIYDADTSDDWTIRWSDADCGYGVTQVTDGMRLAGKEKPGETAMPYQTQRAVALDFAANVAAGLRILQDKWNQTRSAGLVVNNGDVSKIENWFFAVWAYNSGFYPQSQAGQNGGAWGVGWANNPANPKYPANRDAFLDRTYQDAAHPQHWPYPEKVLGWAGHPVEVLESPDVLVSGYRPAWWNGDETTAPKNRSEVKPPPHQFCDAGNNCVPGATYPPTAPDVIGEPAGPCDHKNAAGQRDLKCWYHQPSTWKIDCPETCGNELLRFDPGYAYQDDGTAYPPNCSLSGLPSGAKIIDDLPDGTPSIRPNCDRTWTNQGTFTFQFQPDSNGNYPGKADTHQIGGGFGGHFWFTHTRTAQDEGGRLRVDATWRLNQSITGLWKVLVALPDHGAHTTKARYVVRTANGERVSTLSQPGSGNRWASLGTFRFNNQPDVQLSSVTPDGDGTQDIAFDAVAFVPVPSDTLTSVDVLHWNLAGGNKNKGRYDVVERLVQEVQVRNPDVISLNEVCLRQFEHLNVRLREIGYEMSGYYHASNLIVPDCTVAPDTRVSAGNAVLVKGSMVSHQGWVFNADDELEERIAQPGEALLGVDRSVACVVARLPGAGRDLKVCSTHLQQDDDTAPNPYEVAEKQVREMARVFGPEARTMPLILAGDFNIRVPPSNGTLGTIYADPAGTGEFNEVDQERDCGENGSCVPRQSGNPTHWGNKLSGNLPQKIDYVFASRWHLYVPPGRAQHLTDVGTCGDDNHPCSDHYIFRSQVLLPG
ncbi:endonuclease/exonuclease/phosphatase family protein [Sphaerisporangium sp. NPDC005289]|uniref:endonuclease/exonuclease/phosphatase family protein n=1 Tax=Sphaerisporangium sp. NPDC005289 TaxID=3155247 RepID=UPI0033A8F429